MGGSLGTPLAMWDPQAPALAAAARLIRFEHRGHGSSPLPPGPHTMAALGADVLALLDRLGLSRVTYCGLSLGGMVGMWLAVNAPERIERLVLVCASACMPTAAGYGQRAAAVREAGSTEFIADAVVARWFTPSFAERRPELVARYREMIVRTPAEGYAACCEAIAGFDLREQLKGITAPTLVIAGAEDPATPPDQGAAIAAAVPGARLAVVDQAAHLANVEQADQITQLILDHLRPVAP